MYTVYIISRTQLHTYISLPLTDAHTHMRAYTYCNIYGFTTLLPHPPLTLTLTHAYTHPHPLSHLHSPSPTHPLHSPSPSPTHYTHPLATQTSKSDLEADNSNFGLKIIYNRRNDTNTPAFSVMEGPGTNASATEHTLAAMRASLSNKLEIESIMELALEDEQQLVNDQEAKRSSYESLPVASIEAQASEVVNSAEKTEDKPTVPSAVETDYYE